MAAKKTLIRTIRNRCAGRPYDVEGYVRAMDRLMDEAWNACVGRRRMNIPAELDKDAFMNDCWKRVEDEKLVFKLADLSFEDDDQLRRYARRTFTNLFLQKAEERSPGFRARRKQVNRTLKKICLESCRKWCGCWKLAEFRGKACVPADRDRLWAAAGGLPFPAIRVPRDPDARAPAVRDHEMTSYLAALLRAAGGMAQKQELLAFITRVFNLYAVRISSGAGSDAADTAPDPRDLFLSPDHLAMARELVRGMTRDMRDIHYYRLLKEMTLEQTARAMRRSAGTVHNREKAYKAYLQDYFGSPGGRVSPGEREAVMRIVSAVLLRTRDSS